MDKIGHVKAIVNQDLIIVQVDVEARVGVGDRLTIFTRAKNDQLFNATGLEHIDIPKGEIEITTKQSSDLYLAERFRHASTEFKASPFSGMLGLLLESRE